MLWLLRLRRRRRVRVHFLEAGAPTVEGVLVGTVAGHYRLKMAAILESVSATVPVDDELWVPKHRVFLVETVRAS